MASRRVLGSLGGRAAAVPSPAGHATKAATTVCRAKFTSAANNGDPAPAPGSEEDDKGRAQTTGGGDGPAAGRAAAEIGEKAGGAAEEMEEAGREVKDTAKEAGEGVKEAIKETR